MTKTEVDTLVNTFRTDAAYFQGVKGGFYGQELIQKLLSQPGADGIRYYHGLGPDPFDGQKIKQTIVLMAEDSSGNILTGMMIEEGPLCPPYCPISGAPGS